MGIVKNRCYPKVISRALCATYDVIRKNLYSIGLTSTFCIVVDNIITVLNFKNLTEPKMLSESTQSHRQTRLSSDNILERCYPGYPELSKRLAEYRLRTDNFSPIGASNMENDFPFYWSFV